MNENKGHAPCSHSADNNLEHNPGNDRNRARIACEEVVETAKLRISRQQEAPCVLERVRPNVVKKISGPLRMIEYVEHGPSDLKTCPLGDRKLLHQLKIEITDPA